MIGQGRTLVKNDEHRFDEEMRRYCDEARSLGYFPSDFLGMLDRYGAVAVAKKLIMSGDLQTGLRKLAKMKRLDLSIESLMLEPGFRHLFSKNELASAEFRLRMAETEV